MANPEVNARILRRLLASGAAGRAERLLARMQPADIAPLLSGLTPDEIRTAIELLFRQRRAASVVRELPPELLPAVTAALADQRLADVIGRLEMDDMLELVAGLPEERRVEVVAHLSPAKREELEKAERYPASSAGRVMTTHFVALDEKLTAQQAIDRIRGAGDEIGSIFYLYVVDDAGRLRGVIPLRRLVTAPPSRSVSELMITEPVSVGADADQETAAQLVARYDLLALPVTDAEGRMLGVITVDDVIDVIHEEATEDMYLLAGLSEEDRVFSPALLSVRRRLPWMLANLGTCFLAAWVVGWFERALEQVVTLAVFMPVVAGMGGNGGIQAVTVITRGIALGEIEFSTGLRAVAKELGVGLLVGLLTGLVSALFAFLWQGNPWLGVTLVLAMMVTLGVAGLAGAAVPLLLQAMRLDPALGAGVIVTTFTDVFGFFSFLGIATLLLDRLS
jgi:magnesium transporter